MGKFFDLKIHCPRYVSGLFQSINQVLGSGFRCGSGLGLDLEFESALDLVCITCTLQLI